MQHLIYLHGFLSAPASTKAQQTAEFLSAQPNWQYHCPALSSYPAQAFTQIEHLLASLQGQPIALIGSSLGGFWAQYWAMRLDLPAVLINPAVHPGQLLARYIGQRLQNYYSAHSYELTEQDAAFLNQCDTQPLEHPDNLWVLLQTGDETLDYRHAAAYFAQCRLSIDAGGNHSFTGFETHLSELLQFFADFWAKKGILRA